MLSRDQSLRSDTWNLLGTSGHVFDSPCAVIDSSSTPYQGMLHSWNQSATGENQVRDSTGKLVARSEERNRETIPTPRFVRRPSTMNSFCPPEGVYPLNYMAVAVHFTRRFTLRGSIECVFRALAETHSLAKQEEPTTKPEKEWPTPTREWEVPTQPKERRANPNPKGQLVSSFLPPSDSSIII